MVTEKELRKMIVDYGNDRDLARKVGLHFNSVYRFKVGSGSITLKHAEKIYNYLANNRQFVK